MFGGEKRPPNINASRNMNKGSGKNMEYNCDDCGSKLMIDKARGVGVCENDFCALEHNLIFNDADSNASSVYGEEAQSGAVNDEGKAGTKMAVFNNKDWSGKRISAKDMKKFRRMTWADNNSQREKDPMCGQLKNKLREMFGKDLAYATRVLAEATARKLTPEQEAVRKTLTSSEKKRLKCPKTSICRKPKGIRGETDKQNLEIMALAIASLSYKLFNTAPINEMELMKQYGISKEQLTNAKRTIMDHWKARISQGWAMAPGRVKLVGARIDQLDIVVENLVTALTGRLDAAELDMVLAAFWEVLTALDEPSIDGPVANMAIGMVAACAMYAVLERFNLHERNLNCVAKAVGLSGAGVKSRIAEMKQRYDNAELPQAKEMFKAADEDDDEADAAEENAEE